MTNLLRKFFWRPRGLIRSLAEFRPAESPGGGSVVDLTVRIGPEAQAGHSLVVAELPGGKVIGDTVMAATADDQVFWGVQALTVNPFQEDYWLLRRRRFRMPRHVAGTALLLAMNGDNYFHWCFDSLPRWRLLREAGWDASRADHVVLSHAAPAFQETMLQTIGVPREKWLRCSKWEVLQFDRLIVPSMPVSISGMTLPWMRDFLRTTFLPVHPPAATQKIYISRRASRRRRLVNEAELEECLARQGFQICRLEAMSFGQQVELFASARLMVAPHGAGLANSVFAAPGASLVELFHPEHLRNYYEDIARMCGLGYQAVVGKSVSPRPSPDDRTAEFIINVEDVLKAVAAVGIGETAARGH